MAVGFLLMSRLSSHATIKISTAEGKTSQRLPYQRTLADGAVLLVRRVSSLFTRLTIAQHGIDILLGKDGRLYLTLNPSWQSKVGE